MFCWIQFLLLCTYSDMLVCGFVCTRVSGVVYLPPLGPHSQSCWEGGEDGEDTGEGHGVDTSPHS